jgi:hypothetical protein
MVDGYHKTNQGGLSSSRLNLESSINSYIKDDVLVSRKLTQRKDDIPSSSMLRICNRVMALPEFKIMKSVSNKTESRSTAEYSVRSTISYMMVVATQHFINAKPSVFHSKHSEIKKTPLYLLLNDLNKKH